MCVQLLKCNLTILYSVIPTLRSVVLLPRAFWAPLLENSGSAPGQELLVFGRMGRLALIKYHLFQINIRFHINFHR